MWTAVKSPNCLVRLVAPIAIWPRRLAVIEARGELGGGCGLAQGAQLGDEDVFEGGIIDAHFVEGYSGVFKAFADCGLDFFGIVGEQVEAVAESLHVQDVDVRCGELGEDGFGLAQVCGAKFDSLCAQARTKLARCSDFKETALVHEGDAMAAFGFIEIGRSDKDGEAVGGEMREDVPEFAAGDGIDAGGGLVEQEDARLRDEGADEGKLLLHAAGEFAGEAVGEAVHVEHAQVPIAAVEDVLGRDAA